VTLRLHDTLSRKVRVFRPRTEGQVSIYVCGPTVQSEPHVGHMRSAIAFDLLRRWLTETGYDVLFARNVTDIEDKILHSAGHEGIPWWALAERNTRAFNLSYDALGVLPPTVEPRATGHIPEMVGLIARLVASGAAYVSDGAAEGAAGGGGGVYFDVRALPSYGRLSGQRPDALLATEDGGGKRDPLDFALWKPAKPGEPAWQTPWGPGRPGWHVECSAMATHYLGSSFDIHGGGLDLIFPHHENELAQSTAAGDGFARYWLHHGLVNVGSEKMSKSLGNSLLVSAVLERVRPQVLRYLLGAAHYRSGLTWSDDALADAESAYGRLETFVRNATDVLGDAVAGDLPVAGSEAGKAAWDDFATAMDDDLAVPRALGALHSAVRAGNAALDADAGDLAAWLGVVRRMMVVLGLDPVTQWRSSDAALRPVVDALVAVALQARQDARARADFASADAIRASLAAAGLVVEDTASGPRWRLAGR
jgi:cysteinyl-tRNA synthetase